MENVEIYEQRSNLKDFVNQKVVGYAIIQEISLVYGKFPSVLLVNITLKDGTQVDHCWVRGVKSEYFYGIGAHIIFIAKVERYKKNGKKYGLANVIMREIKK